MAHNIHGKLSYVIKRRLTKEKRKNRQLFGWSEFHGGGVSARESRFSTCVCHVAHVAKYLLRATFCNHRESPDSFNFFESLIISPKIPFDELFLKTILKTSSDIYFFENFRKIDRAPEVPVFECKLCTKAQHHRTLQKSPIRLRLLTKPSLSFIYMCDMIRYPYLNKWPFLTAFITTTWECRDRWSKIAHFRGEWNVPGMSLFTNPISWSPSNMSQHCSQRIPESNSKSFRPRKSTMSSPLPVNCQKIISEGQVNKTRFAVLASEIIR